MKEAGQVGRRGAAQSGAEREPEEESVSKRIGRSTMLKDI